MSILVFSPNGTHVAKPTLEAARTSADCTGKTIVVTSALTAAQSDITAAWPADRALEVKKGGSIANTTAFTINGSFIAGLYQVFVGSGVVTLRSGVISPAWFLTLGAAKASAASSGGILKNEPNTITPLEYGAIADGGSHPLSTRYGTLAAAQIDYPFATALTQEIDWAAVQSMSFDALGEYSTTHGTANPQLNRPIHIPAGRYYFGADPWIIKNGASVKIYGDGRNATTISGTNVVFQTDGFWFSTVEGIRFVGGSVGLPAVDIDGNVYGVSIGVQGNTFRDCFFVANPAAPYATAITRVSGSVGQGSENIFINCHWQGDVTGSGQTALYFQNGFNALQNTIIGGNFQVYNKHAICLQAGSIIVHSTGFQSTTGYTQILNDGYDIDTSYGGVNQAQVIIGCRTESARFFRGCNASPGMLVGNSGFPGFTPAWAAAQNISLNSVATGISPLGVRKFYLATTAGITGASAPVWPETGTVTDGSVVWTMLIVEVVVTATSLGNSWWAGNERQPVQLPNNPTKVITANYVATYADEFILCDTTAGNITVTLPIFGGEVGRNAIGKRYYIKKATTDVNTVTVITDENYPDDAAPYPIIPGSSKGYMQLEKGARADGSNAVYWIIGKSF